MNNNLKNFLLFGMAIVICAGEAMAQCNTSTTSTPASVVNDSTFGSTAWSDVSNVSSSDNNYGWSSAITLGDTTHMLMITDFGMTIPPTASICGVEVSFEHSATGTLHNVNDNTVRLIKGGVLVGDNKAKSAIWPDSDATVAYGDSTDIWGTTLTPAEINSSDFGVAIAVDLSGVSVLPTARIDQVTIKVNYSASVLPIELISFIGERLDNNFVELSWSTASEVNNDYFTLERSVDGNKWSVVGGLGGAGTSKTVIDYVFQDNNDISTHTYYRLKQTDFDGHYEYSKPIVVEPAFDQVAGGVEVFPNPTNDGRVKLKSANGVAKVVVYNQFGGVVTTQEHQCDAAPTMPAELQVPQEAKGVMITQVTDCNGQEFYEQLIAR